ncbi:ATP-binding protein [Thiocapsa imhoffii]|uniref:ATP-binding protein n=1 Tax=Thiocapsa imhoffii TaxID=382777 RepID=UPI001908E781
MTTLLQENLDLRACLEEAQDALRAIREGEVDAVIVSGSQGDRVFSLMETENLHRLMVETMNEAGLAISLEGILLYANDRACALLQRTRSGLLGHAIDEFVGPLDRQRLCKLLDASQTGTADDRIVFLTDAEAEVPMHLWASRLPRCDGDMICLVGTDLSRLEADQALLDRLREHQEALKASRAQALESMSQALAAREQAARAAHELRESDRLKDAFLATLAHELRNPLAPMRNALSILRLEEIDPSTLVTAREMMERQLLHLIRLVDDLMEVARITHGKIDLRKERLELTEVIDSAVETVQPLLDATGQLIEVERASEPVWLEGDRIRLSQVFGNLLNNAIKYTNAGEVIRIRVQPKGEGVEISIRDPGIGISPEMLPRVFEMFAQGRVCATQREGGLGIGLTLVRKLVELHGGRIEALSEGSGQGSEMRVYLPLGVPCTPRRPSRAARHQSGGVQASTLAKHHILVVDDNRDAATSLATLLRYQGAVVRIAYDGRSALDALETEPADVVILDIRMPDLDGREVARRIRMRPEWNDIRLIAMTGLGEAADRQRSREAGFDVHLVKPVSIESLDELFRDPVTGYRAEEQSGPNRSLPPRVPREWALSPDHLNEPSLVSLMMHDLAQPLSSAACYAVAARTLAERPTARAATLDAALAGIEGQLKLASRSLERLRDYLLQDESGRDRFSTCVGE